MSEHIRKIYGRRGGKNVTILTHVARWKRHLNPRSCLLIKPHVYRIKLWIDLDIVAKQNIHEAVRNRIMMPNILITELSRCTLVVTYIERLYIVRINVYQFNTSDWRKAAVEVIPLLSSKTRSHFRTHKWSWDEQSIVMSPEGAKNQE